MASKVDVCNLALARADLPLTQDIESGAGKADKLLRLFWGNAVESVLRAHPWNFAARREPLAEKPGPRAGWAHAYALPADCLFAREVWNRDPGDPEKIRFEVARGPGGTKELLTDEGGAVLLYTARADDPSQWDALFVNALAAWLAAELALAVKGSLSLHGALRKEFDGFLAQARAEDAAEGKARLPDACSYLEARK